MMKFRLVLGFALAFFLVGQFAEAGTSIAAPLGYIDSSTVTDASPITYRWSAVAGAKSYVFQLLNPSDDYTVNYAAGTDTNSFVLNGAVYGMNTVYHYRVCAVTDSDACDRPGSDWSSIGSFMLYNPAAIPRLLGPVGILDSASPIVFSWAQAAGAVSYHLVITAEDDQTVINEFAGLTDTSFALPANMPLPARYVYHYKVQSRMGDGSSSLFSNPGSFMVAIAKDVPRLLSPSPTRPLALTAVNFSWTPVEGAVGYQIQVMSEDESAVLIDQNVAVNGFAFDSANAKIALGGVYHWRVRSLFSNAPALFGSVPKSSWSETLSFNYYDDRIVPYTLQPFGVVNSRGGLVLEWSQVNSAVRYDIEIRDSVTQALLYTDSVSQGAQQADGTATAPDTQYDLRAGAHAAFDAIYSADKSFDWSVRAKLADGSVSRFSWPKAFRVATRLSDLEAWSGAVEDPVVSIVRQEQDYSNVTTQIVPTGIADYANHILKVDYYDRTENGKKDVLGQVTAVVPQLELTLDAPIRYHFVLRTRDTSGAHTIWSGDGHINATGDVELTLPSDVSTVLAPSTIYYFVVQAFSNDGVQIGSSERQIIPAGNWVYNSSLADYVLLSRGGIDDVFNFTLKQTVISVSSLFIRHGTDSDLGRFDAYVAKLEADAKTKAAWDAMSKAERDAIKDANAARYEAWLDSLSTADKAFVLAQSKATSAMNAAYSKAQKQAAADLQVANTNADHAYSFAVGKADEIYRDATAEADVARVKALASSQADLAQAKAKVIAANAKAANAIAAYNAAIAAATDSKTKKVNAVAKAAALSVYNQAKAGAAKDLAAAQAAVQAANAKASAANQAYSVAVKNAADSRKAAYAIASSARAKSKSDAAGTYRDAVAIAKAALVSAVGALKK